MVLTLSYWIFDALQLCCTATLASLPSVCLSVCLFIVRTLQMYCG